MKNNLFKWIGLFTAILFLAFAASCDSSSSDDEEIPEDVLEAAEGTFELIGEVLLAPSGSPEPGVSITESGSTKTVTLINYSPEYGVTITGNLQIITVSTSPYSFSITGSAVITGELNAEISLEATASWTDGGSPESGPPSAMTGTFTYNGKSYDVIDIMEAIEELEDDDIGPDDAPPFDDNVLGTADGIFSLIGLMMEDPADYPSGVSVTGDDVNKVMELRGFEPEPGIYVSGSISVTVTATSPFAMSVTVSITMSGEFDATVAMTANASWETGDPGYDPPSAINGTLTFNGTGYSVAELLAALE